MQSWDDRLPWYTGYIYLIIFYVIFHICWRRSIYTCRHSSFVFYTPSTSSHTGAPDTIIIIHTEAVLKSISFYNKLFLSFWSSLTSCTSVLIFASHLVFVLFCFFRLCLLWCHWSAWSGKLKVEREVNSSDARSWDKPWEKPLNGLTVPGSAHTGSSCSPVPRRLTQLLGENPFC